MARPRLLTLYAAARAWTDTRWNVVAIGACALGMGAKESMVVAPILVLLYDRALVADSFKAALGTRWRLYAGLAGGWLLLGYLMQSGPRSRTVGFGSTISGWT